MELDAFARYALTKYPACPSIRIYLPSGDFQEFTAPEGQQRDGQKLNLTLDYLQRLKQIDDQRAADTAAALEAQRYG